MKKWALTVTLAVSFIATGMTANLWVPWLLSFAFQNKERVEQLNTLAELTSRVVSSVAVLALFIWRLWSNKRGREARRCPVVAVRNAPAARDALAAGGDIQTGGAHSQRDLVLGGDLVSGDKTILYHVSTAGPPLGSLHQLPPPPADFTGRDRDLDEIREAIEAGGATICGLQGQGGVGKTALALKLAEKLASRYPDAQMYVDLRGASEEPLTPADAMAHVVRAFHPELQLPDKEHELGGLYRSSLHGKRALLLMDDARDAAQVRPLLPPAGCALLVTSRQHFSLPGLHARHLDTLPPAEAEALLLRIAPRIGGQAEAIARLCGNLPLALRLAAATLAERVDLDPRDYAKRLAGEKSRLKMLSGSDGSVEASINLSYGLLESEVQERWRMLAVFPDTFDAPAAAAVWQVNGDGARDTLGRLTQCSMLGWDETIKRYRLHDLMQHFAGSRLEPLEWKRSLSRHSSYYVDVLREANKLYLRGGESVVRGLALFDLERGNTYAGQDWAAAHAADNSEAARLCNSYPDAGRHLLSFRQHPRERIRWLDAALAAAISLKDREGQAAHLGNLGLAYASLDEIQRAIECHARSIVIYREIGDRRGEATELSGMGNCCIRLGDPRGAIGYYSQALSVFREISARRTESTLLVNLGIAYHSLGDYRGGIGYFEESLAAAREIGDRYGEGIALNGLGCGYADLGQGRRAIEYYSHALRIFRELGDRRGEGDALGNLGSVYNDLGDTRRAIEYHTQGLTIAREIGDRRGERTALSNLGVAHYSLREPLRAIEYYERALASSREAGDRLAQSVASGNLGAAYDSLGDWRRAAEHHEQRLGIARDIGDRGGEAAALRNMSITLDKLGERAKAIEHAEAALKIFEEIGDPCAKRVRSQIEQWRKA